MAYNFYNLKIRTKHVQKWDGHKFQVKINGVKYPKEKGAWYHPSMPDKDEAKFKSIRWAIAEFDGKFLSPGGIVYNSKKEYEKKIGV